MLTLQGRQFLERVTRHVVSAVATIAVSGCSVVGIRSGTEEPRFHVIERLGTLDIRQYDMRIAAETTVDGTEDQARSVGFRCLAGYIFGANTGSAHIAMTAPVAQQVGGNSVAMTAPVMQDQVSPGDWRIRFFMPQQYTLETLPRPDDSAVHIVAVPPQTIAVYRYTGSIAPSATAQARRELLRLLEGSGWSPVGEPFSWFYDPPWTVAFLRRNEAAVVVQRPVPSAPTGLHGPH